MKSIKKKVLCAAMIGGVLISGFNISAANAAPKIYDDYKTGYKLLHTMTFVPHTSFGNETVTQFNHALYEWNSAAGWALMSREPIIRHNSTFYPSDDGNNYIYKINQGSQYLAETTWWHYENSDITTQADININPNFPWANSPQSGYYDVWSAFLHEAGHVAGLSDNPYDPDSAMYDELDTGESKRTLDETDKAVLNTIY